MANWFSQSPVDGFPPANKNPMNDALPGFGIEFLSTLRRAIEDSDARARGRMMRYSQFGMTELESHRRSTTPMREAYKAREDELDAIEEARYITPSPGEREFLRQQELEWEKLAKRTDITHEQMHRIFIRWKKDKKKEMKKMKEKQPADLVAASSREASEAREDELNAIEESAYSTLSPGQLECMRQEEIERDKLPKRTDITHEQMHRMMMKWSDDKTKERKRKQQADLVATSSGETSQPSISKQAAGATAIPTEKISKGARLSKKTTSRPRTQLRHARQSRHCMETRSRKLARISGLG